MNLNSARQVRGEKYVGRNGWDEESELMGGVSLYLFLERAE